MDHIVTSTVYTLDSAEDAYSSLRRTKGGFTDLHLAVVDVGPPQPVECVQRMDLSPDRGTAIAAPILGQDATVDTKTFTMMLDDGQDPEVEVGAHLPHRVGFHTNTVSIRAVRQDIEVEETDYPEGRTRYVVASPTDTASHLDPGHDTLDDAKREARQRARSRPGVSMTVVPVTAGAHDDGGIYAATGVAVRTVFEVEVAYTPLDGIGREGWHFVGRRH